MNVTFFDDEAVETDVANREAALSQTHGAVDEIRLQMRRSNWARSSQWLAGAGLCVAVMVACWTWTHGAAVHAQIPGIDGLLRHAGGQNVGPIFEGWYATADGAIGVSFGYLSRNWEDPVDIPVGPDNRIEPGSVDQGQPTHFLPRRHHGVFVVVVPDTSTEVTWTLTAVGETVTVPSNFDLVYAIEPEKIAAGSWPGNTPPMLRFEPAGAGGQGPIGTTATLTASVSQPLALDVWVTDDGLPGQSEYSRGPAPTRTGPRVMWSTYRGTGAVHFSEPDPDVEQGKASTFATFDEPGDYRLRVLVSDGSNMGEQCCWTNGYVNVSVGGGRE